MKENMNHLLNKKILFATGNESKAADWITDEDITAACHTDFTNNKVLGINTYGNATIGKTYAFHYTASADL